MLKINKDFNLKVISLIMAVLFVFNSTVYGIDLPRNISSKLRAPFTTQSKPERLREGMAAMLDTSSLTPREHQLLNSAFSSFFTGFDNIRQDIRIAGSQELADIDPENDLRSLNGLKVYIITEEQLRKALADHTDANEREIYYLVNNLISHPGRFRTQEGKPRAINLFILEKYYTAIRGLNVELKSIWAKHEREHLENIDFTETNIANTYPLDEVVKPLGHFKKPKANDKRALKEAVDLITREVKKPNRPRPLLVFIDGDARVGKTVLADDITLLLPDGISCKVFSIDDYHRVEYITGDLLAYLEQYGGETIREYWDYGEAAIDINALIKSGGFDLIIIEGLNSLFVESKLVEPYVKFDIKIHVIADRETREYIFMKRFPERTRGMEDYLTRYVQRYSPEIVRYDIVIDNSLINYNDIVIQKEGHAAINSGL